MKANYNYNFQLKNILFGMYTTTTPLLIHKTNTCYGKLVTISPLLFNTKL